MELNINISTTPLRNATKRDLADTLLEGNDMSAKISLNELVELIRNV
jgi:hypothetical protein